MKKKGLDISTKSFVTATVIVLILMVLTYCLSFIMPGGQYDRILDSSGNSIFDPNGGFHYVQGGIPFWKWLLSPILVLAAEGSGTIIAVIAFLLIVGGAFNCLDKCGLMEYLLKKIVSRYGATRYRLLAVISLFFMLMGSFVGSFEEVVPLVPILVALSVRLGWDTLTGLGISVLSISCGFAAGICNPFTVGVAQELAGLPMFSGMWLRAVSFVLIYLLLLTFLTRHAKKVERPISPEAEDAFARDPRMERGLKCFAVIMVTGILLVLSSGIITVLQSFTMIIVAVMFLISGIAAPLLCGMTRKKLLGCFLSGIVSICPAILLILMASSIKYTMVEAHLLDTMLHGTVELAQRFPQWVVVIMIYLIVLIMNFFIGSGSAKAFLLIPLIVPAAQMFRISPQLSVLAFAFGDGFSNVFYPTNPVILISLGLAGTSYSSWFKYSWKFQFSNLLLTSAILLFGLAVGYC